MEQSERKKIMLVALDFPPVGGGISVAIYNFFKYFPPDSFVVVTPYHKGAEQFDQSQNFKIIRTKKERKNNSLGKLLSSLDLFFLSRRALKSTPIKEIHCLHLFTTGYIGYISKTFSRIDYYIHVFGAEFKRHSKYFWILKIFLDKAKGIIANSDHTLKIYQALPIQNKNIISVTPGVDLNRFRPGLDVSKLREKHRLSGKKVIFTVSRLEAFKGADTVIKVLPSILRVIPNTVFLVGGTGPYQETLKKMAADHHLEDNVIFLNHIPDEDLPLYYNLCDLFVLLTRESDVSGDREGFGIVFLEANACEKPVIGGNAGGTYDAVEDGVSGYLVDPLNMDEITGKIEKLLTNETLAKKLGVQGRKRAEASFSWEYLSFQLWNAINK